MDDAELPPANAEEPTSGQRSHTSGRRSRERKRRKAPPAAVKRNYLLHILFYDRAFRWFAVVAILLFGGMGAMWPRIFVTSPKGVSPESRVSGIDLLKAKSLKKTARAADAAGNPEAAIQAWIAALGSNPADLEANRGLLLTLANQARPDRAWLPLLAFRSDWTLRLSGTNHGDLELAARANAAYGQWDWIIARLSPTNSPRTEVTTPSLLAALMEKGMVQRFAAEWAAHRDLAKDPASALYAAAWTAGWGPADEYLQAMDTLEAAAREPAHQALALRLLLRVDHQRLDVAAYEQHFNRLQAAGGARVRQHVRFWNLLRLTGQRERAVELARSFGERPESVDEAEMYLSVLASLKQNRLLLEFAKDQLPAFGSSPTVWVAAAEALIGVGEWDELRGLAIGMRQVDGLRLILGNLGHFFEGVGEHHLGRQPRAADAFDRFLQLPPEDPRLTFAAAVMMRRLGYPEQAAPLLRGLETKAGNSAEFWRQMQQTSYETRDVDGLIEASRRLYLLQSADPVVANNYAASLLLRGENGPEAVKVTLEVLEKIPNSVSARVNRALALIRVGRLDEVPPLLASVADAKLEPPTAAILEFTRFLLHDARGQRAEALAAAARVESRFLFPDQLEQLNAAVARLKGPR